MTNQQHPITPPPELMKEWIDAWYNAKVKHDNMTEFVAIQAARWGADQELEACCVWLKVKEWIHPEFSDELRAARRPKPLSLKEQALAELAATERCYPADYSTIRRALEALPDD